jgi:hypothetical protein
MRRTSWRPYRFTVRGGDASLILHDYPRGTLREQGYGRKKTWISEYESGTYLRRFIAE